MASVFKPTYVKKNPKTGTWKKWLAALTPAVIQTQRQDGNYEGSWDPVGVWGEDGGRIYATALMVLTLESHYRHIRLVR